MLQYRRDYVNRTPILGAGMMQATLMLIDVAYLGKNRNDSLVFVNGDKHGIWPSMFDACKTIITIRFVVHACSCRLYPVRWYTKDKDCNHCSSSYYRSDILECLWHHLCCDLSHFQYLLPKEKV